MLSFSHVGIICFAASYAVVLAMEVSRLLFRSGIRGAMMLVWAGAGLLAHTAYLYYRAVEATGAPLSNWRDWYLVAAWALMVVYLYLLYFHPRTSIGLFLLPLVLGLIATATFVAGSEPFAREPASKIWGAIHGTALAGAVVSMLVGFAAGMMYLHQTKHLKHKRPMGQGMRLPSLEWLQKINHRAIIIALIMLGVGVLGGMTLNAINYRSKDVHLPWSDPLILSTIVMFVWLLAAVIVSHVYRPARQGRKVVYLTMISFVFLLASLAVGLLLNTQHGRERIQDGLDHRNQKIEKQEEPGEKDDGRKAKDDGRVVLSEAPAWRGEWPAAMGEREVL